MQLRDMWDACYLVTEPDLSLGWNPRVARVISNDQIHLTDAY